MQTTAQISAKQAAAYFNVKQTLKQTQKHVAASLKVKEDYKTRGRVFSRLNTWSQFLCKPTETRKVPMLQRTARRPSDNGKSFICKSKNSSEICNISQQSDIYSRLALIRHKTLTHCLFYFIYFIFFVFYLFNVGHKNMQLKEYHSNSFSIKRKC